MGTEPRIKGVSDYDDNPKQEPEDRRQDSKTAERSGWVGADGWRRSPVNGRQSRSQQPRTARRPRLASSSGQNTFRNTSSGLPHLGWETGQAVPLQPACRQAGACQSSTRLLNNRCCCSAVVIRHSMTVGTNSSVQRPERQQG